MAHLKKSIIEIKAKQNGLAHALIISIARLTNDPNYIVFLRGYKIRSALDHLLATTGRNLANGGGIPELMKFQKHFKEFRIVFG
jgi:hypothetical protein